MNTYLVLTVFAVFLIVTVAVIIALFLSLAKQGGERRKIIVANASAKTFAVTILSLCLWCTIWKM